jgi:multidrug efflux pump subunit AcrA (membrane-fusion protein)
LAAGLFVEAEILGRVAEHVTAVPRSAVRDNDQVLIVDDESRLRFRTVDILRTTAGDVIVRAGLSEGERICLSPLVAVTEGMLVRTVNEES